jgi:hypothetical protein
MHARPLLLALFVLAVASAPACTSGPTPSAWTGTVEDVRTSCHARQASPAACTSACFVDAYADAVDGPCAAEHEAVRTHAETNAFYDCATACPLSVRCTSTPYDLTDCDCMASCAASLSESFQHAWIARELCIADATEIACR